MQKKKLATVGYGSQGRLARRRRRKTAVLFTVHQNRRRDVDFLAIKNLINSGEIGETISIESRIHGSRGTPSDCRCHKQYGGGMIL